MSSATFEGPSRHVSHVSTLESRPRTEGLVARVVRSVIAEMQNGTLQPTERLPSEREYAAKLYVSRNTVTAAYAVLEQQGIIRRLRGKGAFVCALPMEQESFSWSGKIASRANLLDEPVLELLARRCADGMPYPFSAGTPSLDVFPEEAFAASGHKVMREELRSALAVAPTEGQWRTRETVAQWIGVDPQHVMITAGAQEAIDLLARCLIEPGDYAIVDSPTYPGIIQSLRSAGAQLLAWETNWALDHLEDLLLRFRPKLIFTIPTFHNPTGRVMSAETRLGLLELAHRYRVPVIEDDVYSRTFFGVQPQPESLYTLDTHSQVITLSTFSKMLAPGLRIGWLVAPTYMVKQLSLIKMRSNLFTGGMGQLVVADLIRSGEMDRHLVRLRQHHAELCASAVEALMPAIREGLLKVRVPAGGLYLWCRLAVAVDAELLWSRLQDEGVSVAPGFAFEPGSSSNFSGCFRLCFTAASKDVVSRGALVLTEAIREQLATARAH